METKKCIYCGKDILIVAKKCKHCGKWLDEKSTSYTPQSKSQNQSYYGESSASKPIFTPAQPVEKQSASGKTKFLLGIMIGVICFCLIVGLYYITQNKQEQLTQNEQEQIDVGFDDFTMKFFSNKDYQLSHIKFPLQDSVDPFGEEEEVIPAPTKESWNFISSDLFFVGEKKINGENFSGALRKEGQYMIYSLGWVESELAFTLIFEKIDNEWMLVEYI